MGIKSTTELTREEAENRYVSAYMERANLERLARAEARSLTNTQLEDRLELFSDERAGGEGFDNFSVVSGGPDEDLVDETRTVTPGEAFYDEEVAPTLARLGSRCQAMGMSFCAAVEYAHGEVGQTCCLVPGRSLAVTLVDVAVRVRGNVDALLTALIRHARSNGHGSIYLRRLGVPERPEGTVAAPATGGPALVG